MENTTAGTNACDRASRPEYLKINAPRPESAVSNSATTTPTRARPIANESPPR